MGCGYNFTCKTCKKDYYLGYGSYGSWRTSSRSIQEYESFESNDKELQKNIIFETCLREHEGHDFKVWSDDWCHEYNGNVYVEGGYNEDILLIEGYDDYEKINLEDG